LIPVLPAAALAAAGAAAFFKVRAGQREQDFTYAALCAAVDADRIRAVREASGHVAAVKELRDEFRGVPLAHANRCVREL
jgi:hypothetical protein